MNSMNDELRQRAAEKPDQYTLAWWKEQWAEANKGYRGATHAINRAIAEIADATTRIDSVEAATDSVRQEQEWIKARIGEIQSSVLALTERVDRMAEFLNKMKNGGAK